MIVPLAAASPALAGMLGLLLLWEKSDRRRLAGIGLALLGSVLLAGS